MPAIPESAITFTTLVVGLLTTGVLLLLPSTWQGDGRALRYWVIGNLWLSLDRLHTLWPAITGTPLLPPVLAPLWGACVVAGAGMHVAAMRLLLQPDRPPRDWRWPAGLGLAVGLVGLLLGSPPKALMAVMAGTSLCIVLMLVICLPHARHVRGAMLMSATMGFFLLMNASGLWELSHHAAALPSGDGQASVPVPVAILALDMVLSVVLSLAFLLILIELLQQRVERLSVTDPLTGVLNRRGFLQAASLRLRADHLRYRNPDVSVLLLDLDHFKRINDTLGHPMGDAVLRGAAGRIAGAVRQTDMVARWGGEEFVVLLPGTPQALARDVAERIRQAVGASPLADGAPIVTVSIGVVTRDDAASTDPLSGLIAEADRRLYVAKRDRNRVVDEAQPVA